MQEHKNKIDVLIDDKIYTLVGVESEEYMQKVADYINTKYEDIRKLDFSKSLSDQNVSVLVSVNVVDDLLKSRENEIKLMQENRALRERLDRMNRHR